MVLDLGRPKKIKITPRTEETLFQFHLDFPESSQQPVEFSLSGADAMALMVGLQKLQARHRIPIPPNLRPQGKPVLSVVLPDE